MSNNQCFVEKFFPNVMKVIFRGKPCWITKDVGNVLGYGKEGKNLIDLISREWSDQFVKGEHFDVFRGQELVNFKKVLEKITPNGFTRVSNLSILYEPGICLVLMNTQNKLGKIFKQWAVKKLFAS
jgi:hypothetical protein